MRRQLSGRQRTGGIGAGVRLCLCACVCMRGGMAGTTGYGMDGLGAHWRTHSSCGRTLADSTSIGTFMTCWSIGAPLECRCTAHAADDARAHAGTHTCVQGGREERRGETGDGEAMAMAMAMARRGEAMARRWRGRGRGRGRGRWRGQHAPGPRRPRQGRASRRGSPTAECSCAAQRRPRQAGEGMRAGGTGWDGRRAEERGGASASLGSALTALQSMACILRYSEYGMHPTVLGGRMRTLRLGRCSRPRA